MATLSSSTSAPLRSKPSALFSTNSSRNTDMAYAPKPYVEHPNLRVSVALIVDDPAPCINPLWYFRNQVDGQAEPVYARTIPLDFMQAWCQWIQETGIRGDFTVLPYPAGLGRVDDRLDGYDTGE